MKGPLIERTTAIHEDDYTYLVRPNSDTEGAAVDIAYSEGGDELKYICITFTALPAVVQALSEALAHRTPKTEGEG